MGAPEGLALTTAVIAAVMALPLWRFFMHAITVAHEGGHALIGLLLGGKLTKKKVHLSQGGGGVTHIEITGLGRFFMLLAGYLGPSVIGFAGVQLLVRDFPARVVLMLSLVFSVFVLVLTRNAFGLVVAGGTVALLWLVTMRAPAEAQLSVAYVWVWFLLMGSSRKIPDLYWSMLRREGSDVELLAKQTHVGDVVWLFLFWLGTLAALVYGGAQLLRHTG